MGHEWASLELWYQISPYYQNMCNLNEYLMQKSHSLRGSLQRGNGTWISQRAPGPGREVLVRGTLLRVPSIACHCLLDFSSRASISRGHQGVSLFPSRCSKSGKSEGKIWTKCNHKKENLQALGIGGKLSFVLRTILHKWKIRRSQQSSLPVGLVSITNLISWPRSQINHLGPWKWQWQS